MSYEVTCSGFMEKREEKERKEKGKKLSSQKSILFYLFFFAESWNGKVL